MLSHNAKWCSDLSCPLEWKGFGSLTCNTLHFSNFVYGRGFNFYKSGKIVIILLKKKIMHNNFFCIDMIILMNVVIAQCYLDWATHQHLKMLLNCTGYPVQPIWLNNKMKFLFQFSSDFCESPGGFFTAFCCNFQYKM